MTKTSTPLTLYERVEDALADTHLRHALQTGTGNLSNKRAKALTVFPQMDAVRDKARLIRAHTLSQLDTYLAQFADQIEALGGHVFWAKDAAEANRYVTQVAQANGVKLAVKSKSMVTEEIELNPALQGAGVEVVESDLGEFIIQLAAERPSHIIAPVMHKTRDQVGAIFAEKLSVAYTDDPLALNQIAREHLRRIFLSAQMGISGVNFAVAETGSICLVTNEGNGRLSTTTPKVHVAVMGMERIVPTVSDLEVMLQVLARSATGQKLTVYTNILTGPRRITEADGPDALHVVILDNGRSRVLGSEQAEILYCIRCGACLNGCPVYRNIGGHAYDSVYSGPVGAVLTPMLLGIEAAPDLPHASSLCGVCREVCPVRIDIPRMLLNLRQMGVEAGQAPHWLIVGLRFYRYLAERPALYHLALRLGQTLTRTLGKDGWLDKLPPPLNGWTAHRAFPSLAPQTFQQQWQARQAKKNKK